MVEDTDVQEPNKPMFSSVEEAEKEYKKLQTNLNKAHQTSKEAMLNRFVVDDLVSRVDELTETVIKAGSKDYYENDEENPFRDVEAKGAVRTRAREARGSIASMLLEAGEDFSDPKFEEASRLYQANDWGAAVQATKEAIGVVDADIQTQVDAAVAAALRSRGSVDGGESSSASNGLPSDLDELRSKMRDKSWFREHRSEILKAAKNGQL
jgi:hypothetical protein